MSFTTRVPYYPLVVDSARGSIVTDIEGNKLLVEPIRKED